MEYINSFKASLETNPYASGIAVGVVGLLLFKLLRRGNNSNSKKSNDSKSGVVIVYSLPPAWNSTNSSAFCSKLGLWLKMANIPHEVRIGHPPGPKGKYPYIEFEGELIGDSSLIIEHLTKKFNVTLDSHLTPLDKSYALAFQRLIEEHFYFCILHFRWITEEWELVRKEYFGEAPWWFRLFLVPFMRRSVRQALYGQGISRHSRQEIAQMAIDDLNAISTFLGDKQYLLGSKITTVDASLWGVLDGIFGSPLDNEYTRHAKTLQNLVDYHQRIRDAYFKN